MVEIKNVSVEQNSIVNKKSQTKRQKTSNEYIYVMTKHLQTHHHPMLVPLLQMLNVVPHQHNDLSAKKTLYSKYY